MSGFSSPASLVALKTKIYTEFQAGLTEAPVFSKRLGIVTEVNSDTKFNTYGWLAAMDGMHEWIGPRRVDGFKERAYTVYNKHYEKTAELDADDVDDSPMTAISDAGLRSKMMGEAARKLDDDLVLDMMQNGQARLCFDGQYFFDNDHPTNIDAGAGTQTNYQGSAFALTPANLQAAIAAMMSFKNENGRPYGVFPTKLVVPPALKKTAEDILVAEYGASGASNTQFGIMTLDVVPELAGADTTWYLFDNVSMGPKAFILQRRRNLQTQVKASYQDDNMFWRNKMVFGADVRVGAGYGLWFKAYKAVG